MNTSPADIELFWEQLLEYVEAGRVVPVVGQDLLVLPLAGREVTLYQLLAERLAAKLKVEVESYPRGGELDAVAYRYLDRGGNAQYLYSSLKSVMPPPQELPVPRALGQLARIDPFRLFITTTFDSLLARALDEARFGGEPRTEVFSYSPGAADPGDIGERGAAVLHLFGKLSALSGEYALTAEDKLEFMHSLQSEGSRPRVLDELAERPLLLLGNGFPDWLARFFLRIGSGTRLSARRAKTDVFADQAAAADPSLVRFLRTFGAGIEVFGGDAAEFVDELSRRWSAAHPASAGDGAAAEGPGAPRPERVEAQPGAIFLSYASEDTAAARAIHDALAAKNMEVWFDKQALAAGDDFKLKIRRAIQGSCLFVPILSRHTLTDSPRFFRLEWVEAADLARWYPANRPFILPVAVDDVGVGEEALPEAFRKLHWTRAPEGRTDERFVDTLRDLYRRYQQSKKGSPA